VLSATPAVAASYAIAIYCDRASMCQLSSYVPILMLFLRKYSAGISHNSQANAYAITVKYTGWPQKVSYYEIIKNGIKSY